MHPRRPRGRGIVPVSDRASARTGGFDRNPAERRSPGLEKRLSAPGPPAQLGARSFSARRARLPGMCRPWRGLRTRARGLCFRPVPGRRADSGAPANHQWRRFRGAAIALACAVFPFPHRATALGKVSLSSVKLPFRYSLRLRGKYLEGADGGMQSLGSPPPRPSSATGGGRFYIKTSNSPPPASR